MLLIYLTMPFNPDIVSTNIYSHYMSTLKLSTWLEIRSYCSNRMTHVIMAKEDV